MHEQRCTGNGLRNANPAHAAHAARAATHAGDGERKRPGPYGDPQQCFRKCAHEPHLAPCTPAPEQRTPRAHTLRVVSNAHAIRA